VGLITLIAITAIAVPSVIIIYIAAIIASIIIVLGLAFIYITLAIITFFSQAINKIIRGLVITVVNLVLQ